jgi:hypothetical protein
MNGNEPAEVFGAADAMIAVVTAKIGVPQRQQN